MTETETRIIPVTEQGKPVAYSGGPATPRFAVAPMMDWVQGSIFWLHTNALERRRN
ncbi:hypothetical protein [Amorphus coralli]|uniref:hypothetical protein n=1 Tax=Amorphus coralli TaxID=340680 RepID=UPI0003804488|nr:hypothetical protein [Amorphus coralli]